MSLYRYIAFFLLSLPCFASAQNTGNFWYFNDSLGLQFHEDSYKILLDGVTKTREGTSVICNNDSLLLYSDGVTVWDHNHKIINSGTGLFGNSSSIQSCILLQQPDSKSVFVFTTDASSSEKRIDNNGICYSIATFNATTNKWQLISKNISMESGSNEAITAKKATSFDGYWIIFPEYNTMNLVIYKLDKFGLSFYSRQSVLPHNHVGKSQIKISSTGSKLALLTHGGGIAYAIVLLDFDNNSGTISNRRSINDFVAVGLEFSPNEKYLYVQGYSVRFLTDNIKAGIYQIVLDSIKTNTKLTSSNSTLLFETSNSSSMSITPTQQIFSTHTTSSGKKLSAILQPDSFGYSCNFTPDYITFNNGLYNSSIPNICIDYVLQPYFEVANGCVDSSVVFKLLRNKADSVTWVLGDGFSITNSLDSCSHKYANNGVYSVSVILHYATRTDTIFKTIKIHTIELTDLGIDTLLCLGDELNLIISDTLSTIVIWNTSDTTKTYTVTQAETIIVQASNEYCTAFDTLTVDYIDCGLSIDFLCYGDSTVFALAETNLDSAIFNYNDGIKAITSQSKIKHFYSTKGEYLPSVKLYKNGLSKEINDTITITRIEDDFLQDSISTCEPLQLTPTLSQFDYKYLWNTGQIFREIDAEKSGLYSLQILRDGCFEIDSCFVTLEDCGCPVYIPNSFTPNGDNNNEIFSLWTDCELLNVSMSIYSRWGELLIENSFSWDGTYQGVICPAGVYLWTIYFKDKYNKIHYKSGTVHLLR